MKIGPIAERIERVRVARIAAGKGETSKRSKNVDGKKSADASAEKLAAVPWRFREQNMSKGHTIIVPRVSSENRPYLPTGLLESDCVVQEKAFALYDAEIWNIALVASRLHWVWIGTVCVRKLEDTTFPIPTHSDGTAFPLAPLTAKNKSDLTKCAEDILLAREAHFPKTIADLYDPDAMPDDLRAAHDRNDEVLERIYIGRRFRNDTERLEKLFDLYTKMTANQQPAGKGSKRASA